MSELEGGIHVKVTAFLLLSFTGTYRYMLTSATAVSLWKYVLCAAKFLFLFKLILFNSLFNCVPEWSSQLVD